MARHALLALVASALVMGSACSDGDDAPPPIDADLLGADCSMGQPCGDYTCVEGTCTTACAATTDCRPGTECRSDGAAAFACLAKQWSDEIGVNCALNGDPDCLSGFTCERVNADDPNAYCTVGCASDRECPPAYACLDPTSAGSSRCIRRAFCESCDLDEQCVNALYPDGKCVADTAGGKVCSKLCVEGGETCPAGFLCQDVGGTFTCVHHTGSCTGNGETCDPCTTDEDCAGTAGSICLRYYFSGEQFCSPACGTCPAPYVCGMGQCQPPVAWDGTCVMP